MKTSLMSRPNTQSIRRVLVILPSSIVLFCHGAIGQQILKPVDRESSVRFTIKNFGLRVDGELHGLDGRIIFNPDDLPSSRFEVTVKSASISTGNSARDNHLRKEDYLDVSRYPTIQFMSSQVLQDQRTGTYMVKGDLTIKGRRKSVTIPFTWERKAEGLTFTGSLTINRLDFDVGGSSISLSDHLTLSLAVHCR